MVKFPFYSYRLHFSLTRKEYCRPGFSTGSLRILCCSVLLTGSDATAWRQAAVRAATFLGIKLAAYRIGPQGDLFDPENQWAQKMGVSSKGTVLIRPDSFVAWRSGRRSTMPEQKLQEVLNRILCRSTNR
jgi:putative polyketide hydroxylase